jgi:AraC family transcriptional regulator
MVFEIVNVEPKKLIGKSLKMSFLDNKTGLLWGSFAPHIKHIQDKVGSDRISLQFYSDSFMQNPIIPYTKWASVEVLNFNNLLPELETLEMEGGLYALFHYKGNTLGAPDFFRKIFNECIPNSNYHLDNSRPHFELLSIGKYDPMDEKFGRGSLYSGKIEMIY